VRLPRQRVNNTVRSTLAGVVAVAPRCECGVSGERVGCCMISIRVAASLAMCSICEVLPQLREHVFPSKEPRLLKYITFVHQFVDPACFHRHEGVDS